MLDRRHRLLEPFHQHYEILAARIGLVGNGLFVLGSVLFVFHPGLPAKLCWLLGSLGMLVRAVGRLYTDRRTAHERSEEPRDGAATTTAQRGTDTGRA